MQEIKGAREEDEVHHGRMEIAAAEGRLGFALRPLIYRRRRWRMGP
jgi:hypothetical protein